MYRKSSRNAGTPEIDNMPAIVAQHDGHGASNRNTNETRADGFREPEPATIVKDETYEGVKGIVEESEEGQEKPARVSNHTGVPSQLLADCTTPAKSYVPSGNPSFLQEIGKDLRIYHTTEPKDVAITDTTRTIGHRRVSRSGLGMEGANSKDKMLKLSSEKIIELTHSPQSFTLSPAKEEFDEHLAQATNIDLHAALSSEVLAKVSEEQHAGVASTPVKETESETLSFKHANAMETPQISSQKAVERLSRPSSSARAVSTPSFGRKTSSSKISGAARDTLGSQNRPNKNALPPLRSQEIKTATRNGDIETPEPSPMPNSLPLPPLSFPTYLQLELSSQRPSPLYIHRSLATDFPYESSRVKIERLTNFLLLPPRLEQVLWFGALACLDAWLYAFTILPLRFVKALAILIESWGQNCAAEARFLAAFTYAGLGRMWRRRRHASIAKPAASKSSNGHASDTDMDKAFIPREAPENLDTNSSNRDIKYQRRYSASRRHRRSKSTPSALLPDHKADILKGLLILLTCSILMYFDASRMYHGIRGQAAIKLYVIYNVLEVCDRLFSALGQDVLECLFSKETLERKPDGRSKVLRPFWLFILALAYNLVHSTSLFYQVITLNVAVNSYSNALLTLLMSNQFVEIKSTVFKKFEKDNLFQLTCADVVERFQLWLMLTIIASRNIIETGGLIVHQSSGSTSASSNFSPDVGILPKSFTLLPSWAGQVFGPFLLVLGSEMLVDWLKHAYITKFNNTKPAIYGRFLDVLAKDYYSTAFADQNLTKRLGLPVIPLACLFIRASVQTYHMFVEMHIQIPIPSYTPSSYSTSLTVTHDPPMSSSSSTPGADVVASVDTFIRRVFGHSATIPSYTNLFPIHFPLDVQIDVDSMLAGLTTAFFFLLIYLLLLLLKLILGMFLLRFARHRYRGMKEREGESVHAEGRRVGGWGVVEVDEGKRRWIYADDPEGWRRMRERENRENAGGGGGGSRGQNAKGFEGVERYSMVGKRIW